MPRPKIRRPQEPLRLKTRKRKANNGGQFSTASKFRKKDDKFGILAMPGSRGSWRTEPKPRPWVCASLTTALVVQGRRLRRHEAVLVVSVGGGRPLSNSTPS
ncbi:Hypothetical protein NTJ_09603 [Nesidiocoris tenuis]|uniref:Uncharacterized protein n=1 Tax=Nesidiocoris tenuis TaxID=355587 RepID=A0ABN7AX67_9HEMI|nr:Hypothetical protein NTJ_09603 [Nesidiocoris tenuis]